MKARINATAYSVPSRWKKKRRKKTFWLHGCLTGCLEGPPFLPKWSFYFATTTYTMVPCFGCFDLRFSEKCFGRRKAEGIARRKKTLARKKKKPAEKKFVWGKKATENDWRNGRGIGGRRCLLQLRFLQGWLQWARLTQWWLTKTEDKSISS